MAATLHELEIEIEKIKIEQAILRRDLDMVMNIHKKEVVADTLKSDTNAGENVK